MRSELRGGRFEPVQIPLLPQLVPSRVCLSCDVCCRFPEPDSFLRPYFTPREIRQAIGRGIDPAHFPDPHGCQVNVVPNPLGDGYLCPAFDPATSHCRIYEMRPLDCQIYPLAVMWNTDRSQVVLGWDSKCPFMRDTLPSEIKTYADRVTGLLEREDTLEVFTKNPRLIGRFQEDVVILWPLPCLTERLAPSQPAPVLHPLALEDRARVERGLASIVTPLAAYAFVPHFIWRRVFSYWRADIAEHLCLFAEHADGIFMALPPLGTEPMAVPNPTAFAEAFAFMRRRNRGSAVSRVENVPEEWKRALEALGYRLVPKDPDYLYRAGDLAHLAGDRYKSQRAACNRFVRDHSGARHRYEPYQETDREACLLLYHAWAAQQEARNLDAVARYMLTDSESAHQEALSHHRALGLIGRVVRVDGEIRAYTFGFERSPSVFCILLEVADRGTPGLAQFLFREFCREAVDRGYELANTMDDSGLPSLARSKKAYHPFRLVPNYIVTER